MKNYWIFIVIALCAGSGFAGAAVINTEVQTSTSVKQDVPAPQAEESPAPTDVPPAKPRPDLNEMKGKLLSISYDPKTLRLMTEGGFNVEFSYDTKTVLINGGKKIKVDDLSYEDAIIIRYSGRDLYAIEIDRVSRAPRPQ